MKVGISSPAVPRQADTPAGRGVAPATRRPPGSLVLVSSGENAPAAPDHHHRARRPESLAPWRRARGPAGSRRTAAGSNRVDPNSRSGWGASRHGRARPGRSRCWRSRRIPVAAAAHDRHPPGAVVLAHRGDHQVGVPVAVEVTGLHDRAELVARFVDAGDALGLSCVTTERGRPWSAAWKPSHTRTSPALVGTATAGSTCAASPWTMSEIVVAVHIGHGEAGRAVRAGTEARGSAAVRGSRRGSTSPWPNPPLRRRAPSARSGISVAVDVARPQAVAEAGDAGRPPDDAPALPAQALRAAVDHVQRPAGPLPAELARARRSRGRHSRPHRNRGPAACSRSDRCRWGAARSLP